VGPKSSRVALSRGRSTAKRKSRTALYSNFFLTDEDAVEVTEDEVAGPADHGGEAFGLHHSPLNIGELRRPDVYRVIVAYFSQNEYRLTDSVD
jgi:hypothetical protein